MITLTNPGIHHSQLAPNGGENSHLLFQFRRQPFIIGIQEGDKLTSSSMNTSIAGGLWAFIHVMAEKANPFILYLQSINYLGSIVT